MNGEQPRGPEVGPASGEVTVPVPSPGAEASDNTLLARWADGDAAAAEQLVGRHFDPLLRFFRNRVGDGPEDLVQQTWLACAANRTAFRGEASFRTYLFRIARYQLFAYYRKRKQTVQLDLSTTTAQSLDASATSIIAHKHEEQVLLEALRGIPVDMQVILQLSFWEGLSGAEMAEILGVAENTVYSRVHRAKVRLREAMTDIDTSDRKLRDTFDSLEQWARRIRVSHHAQAGAALVHDAGQRGT